VEAAAGRLPIVAGVASNDIRVAVGLARQSMDAGATAVMVSPPSYYRMDTDSYERWLRAVADEVPAPIMVYAQQWRADIRSGLSLGQLDALASIPNVISIKYGSPAVFHEMITALDRHSARFAFIDNSLGYTFTIGHMHGSSGYIAGPAAWWPEFELRYWDMLEAGNYREAETFHSQLAPYMQFFMGDEFPGSDLPFYFGSAVIKATFEYVGLYGGPVRPPFRELTADQKADLSAILTRLGTPQRVAVAV
jgi:4-hydroxy-tetrahydrodipicolinate synthase